MRELWIGLAVAIGLAGVVSLFVFILLAVISIVDTRRTIRNVAEPITGDGAWPRQTGTYETGVELRHPEPADQVPDESDRPPPLPKSDRRWPGLKVR